MELPFVRDRHCFMVTQGAFDALSCWRSLVVSVSRKPEFRCSSRGHSIVFYCVSQA